MCPPPTLPRMHIALPTQSALAAGVNVSGDASVYVGLAAE